MIQLTTEQQLYLLYAVAYTEVELGTVTKSTVKSYLPKAWKDASEEIYVALQEQKLIEQTSRGRFSLTEQGKQVLAQNLAVTDYRFDSVKGAKVLNALLICLQSFSTTHSSFQSSETMPFDIFHQRFKDLYFEQRKQQALQGVIAIEEKEIAEIFIDKYMVTHEIFQRHFKALQDKGEISVIEGGEGKLIEWVE